MVDGEALCRSSEMVLVWVRNSFFVGYLVVVGRLVSGFSQASVFEDKRSFRLGSKVWHPR